MKSPKILPWIARKAGISETGHSNFGARAISEAEFSPARPTAPNIGDWRLNASSASVEDEVGATPEYTLTQAPRCCPGCESPDPDVPVADGGSKRLPLLAEHLGKTSPPSSAQPDSRLAGPPANPGCRGVRLA